VRRARRGGGGGGERRVLFGRPKSASFQFDHTGPFEPLVLSSEGEAPVVQVKCLRLTLFGENINGRVIVTSERKARMIELSGSIDLRISDCLSIKDFVLFNRIRAKCRKNGRLAALFT